MATSVCTVQLYVVINKIDYYPYTSRWRVEGVVETSCVPTISTVQGMPDRVPKPWLFKLAPCPFGWEQQRLYHKTASLRRRWNRILWVVGCGELSTPLSPSSASSCDLVSSVGVRDTEPSLQREAYGKQQSPAPSCWQIAPTAQSSAQSHPPLA